MKSAEYWKKRFEQVEQSQHDIGVSAYADIENQYRKAQRQIEGQINAWYGRFAKNNNVSLEEARRMLTAKELDELKWDVHEYIKYGQENALNGQWIKELENASARFHISRLEALQLQTQQSLEVMFGNQLDTIDSAMSDVYKSGFYRTAFEVQKGFGVGWDFASLDDKQIAKVINKPWAADGKNFSQRVWGNRTKLVNELNQTLTRNIVLGQDPQKAIDEIAKKMNTSKHNAGRLVMTEEAFFSSEAQRDCFKELDVEEYEIVATLDSHTSDICQDMDGKHFKMSQWEVGTTAPPFHVYCRSTTVPYFADDFGVPGERAARMADGEPTYHVPADMTYKQWQKSFLGGDKSGLNKVQPDVTEEQIKLLQKYGNLTNIMLNGSSDDIERWSELQKITGKGEKELLSELSKNADNWESVLNMQTDSTMKPFTDQLLKVASDDELSALNLWSGETYSNINRYMRFGINVDDISKKAAKDIETVLDKIQTSEEIIVHRGTGTKHIFEKIVGDWKTDPNVLVGQEFSDAGFVATSPLKEGGFSGVGETQAELFIRVPKGTHGAYIAQEAHNELEKEFLLQRGYTYRIIKAEYRSNPIFPDEKDLKVWCEVILDE